jgi:ATP-binding cassette subfamily B (MDR/TAP) protein 1
MTLFIFRYGAILVAHDVRNNCSENCVTGGTVLTVFFCVIMGSIAIGQVLCRTECDACVFRYLIIIPQCQLAPPFNAFISARVAATQLYEVIERTPAIDGLSTEGLIPSARATGNIVADNVYFSYPTRPDIVVCEKYSLNIKAGETVRIRCFPHLIL